MVSLARFHFSCCVAQFECVSNVCNCIKVRDGAIYVWLCGQCSSVRSIFAFRMTGVGCRFKANTKSLQLVFHLKETDASQIDCAGHAE